jgi:prepilin-type N-terminal cleavage/methylation domain-containing protein
MKKEFKGFTLLEILLAVAALVILASIVILAINPTKQLADTRNSQRWVDVNTILNGVYQYAIDNEGALPGDITDVAQEICQLGVATTSTECNVSLDALVPVYLVDIPVDPRESGSVTTGYSISTTTTANRVKVEATNAEQDVTIEVVR